MTTNKETLQMENLENISPEKLKIITSFIENKTRNLQRGILIREIIGSSVGAFFALAGLALVILGFSGNIEWFFQAGNVQSRLTNASPGIVFAIIGLIILWRYKPKKYSEQIGIDPDGIKQIIDIAAMSPPPIRPLPPPIKPIDRLKKEEPVIPSWTFSELENLMEEIANREGINIKVGSIGKPNFMYFIENRDKYEYNFELFRDICGGFSPQQHSLPIVMISRDAQISKPEAEFIATPIEHYEILISPDCSYTDVINTWFDLLYKNYWVPNQDLTHFERFLPPGTSTTAKEMLKMRNA
jgi:hypothetical protein